MKAKNILSRMILAIMLLCVPMLSGCTHNNGDIGDWFGRWKLLSITADGEQVNIPQCFWSFQNQVLQIDYLSSTNYEHDTYFCVATWSEPSENTLVIDFNHSDNTVNQGDVYYTPFSFLHLPAKKASTLSITERSSDKVTLKYINPDDAVEYTYHLVKQ